MASFVRRMRLLFTEGHILTEPEATGEDNGKPVMTVTQIVLEQLKNPEPIVYGDKLLVLWSPAVVSEVSGA